MPVLLCTAACPFTLNDYDALWRAAGGVHVDSISPGSLAEASSMVAVGDHLVMVGEQHCETMSVDEIMWHIIAHPRYAQCSSGHILHCPSARLMLMIYARV